ncbi:tetratricopeptide repeat protein [Mesorhizobium sp. 1B3]|uniref:tetratricopeptide repeat protein n=1 Tax=Mesorhizobium sp. 1B3 TaxID=3243599 RepID=UPI003D95A265
MADQTRDHTPDVIRDALFRILDSPDFDATERIRRFLTYVVEETLNGRPERIKAYSIATSVFGRDENFDPQIDSIVRIVAGRMRRSLEHYYLTAGRNDPLHIRIPKGSYVPVFEGAVEMETSPGWASDIPPQKPTARPSILVEAFTEEGDNSTYPDFARGLTRSLVVGLTRFSGFRVFGPEAALQYNGEEGSARAADDMQIDYILRGGATVGHTRFGIDALLVEARTGRTIWADNFERPLQPSEIFSLRNEVANCVARTLAQPYGIIHSDRAKDADGDPPNRLSSYNCVLLFYQYWRTFDQHMAEQVRECLERTIRAEPNYAEAFACLSLVYSNVYRFGNNIASIAEPRERALKLAERAIELAPNSSWSHYARSLAYWFAGDVGASLAALEMGRVLNPNDTAIIGDLGQRYAMLADWEKAVPLLEESFARNPAQPGSYRVGLFLYHYAQGRYEEAFMEARKMGTPQVLYGPITVAMAAAQLGHWDEAREAVRQILELDPAYGDHIVSDMQTRNLHPDLIGLVVEGLRKAGLPGRDTTPSQPLSA